MTTKPKKPHDPAGLNPLLAQNRAGFEAAMRGEGPPPGWQDLPLLHREAWRQGHMAGSRAVRAERQLVGRIR